MTFYFRSAMTLPLAIAPSESAVQGVMRLTGMVGRQRMLLEKYAG